MFDWLKALSASSRSKPGSAARPNSDDPASQIAELKSRGDKYFRDGELARAEEYYRQALAANPEFAEAWNSLGNALCLQGRHAEATACYQKAIALKPDYAGAYNNLGNLLHSQGRLADAIACYEKTLALMPEFAAEVHSNLGGALQQQGNLADAVDCYRKAIELKPEYAGAHSNLGAVLRDQGKAAVAVESFRVALALEPNDAEVHSNLLLIMQYSDNIPPSDVFAEHLQFSRQFEAPLKSLWPQHANVADPKKRLKVGYVSPDFRSHSVAYFIEPVLENHDKSRIEVFCYYNYAGADEFTDRIKRAADHWVSCVGWSDQGLAERIRADGIDILVDLAGHTAHNRMLTFARKPAPVQVTYLGYPNTTGLTAIDYRITDGHADPADMTRQFHVEALWHLPETSWCYRPQDNSPDVFDHPPMEDNGYVTFGCLNNFAKVTDRVIAAWARLLEKVPSSRLLLKIKGIESTRYRAEVEMRFAGLGMPVARLVLLGQQNEHPYMLYNRMDLALDPFPYNGCTTSFDALWMGVPFVSLAGRTSVSRVGVSILANAGLPELIADSEETYVEVAAALAANPARLKALRAGLRERLKQCPLMNARRMSLSFEQAYREMWQEWCAR